MDLTTADLAAAETSLLAQLNVAQKRCRASMLDESDVAELIKTLVTEWVNRPEGVTCLTVRHASRRVANRGRGIQATWIVAELHESGKIVTRACRDYAPKGAHGRGPTWWVEYYWTTVCPPASARPGTRRSSPVSATKTF